ncbi:MAG TPA: HNH endonuclease [Verrucomicrobiae bacterium]|nr:HNH endonuclease [Verrucomicrobiae bacterium]
MKKFEIDFLESYDEKSILEELKRIATVTGKKTVTKKDIKEYGRVNFATVYRHFGCLRKALEKANLTAGVFTKSTDAELLQIIVELWELTLEKEGRRPYKQDLKAYGFPVSHDTVTRRFGSWKKALRAAYDSVNEDNVKSEETTIEISTVIPEKKVASRIREPISLRKRFFVLKRDGFTCQICKKSGVGVRLEVDHKTSVHDKGTNALDNLWTLCFECNRGKSKTSL